MAEQNPVQISVRITPNPNSLQFMTDRTLVENGTYHFTNAAGAGSSKLAGRLFKIDGVAGVLIGSDFVTVTKQPDADWPSLASKVVEDLKAFFASGEAPVEPGAEAEAAEEPLDETGRKIKQIIDEEIRPAVARDGGDIIFDSYEDGVVRLHLQGACSSCPSSVMTLKLGIENRLRQIIPEIKEVIAL